MTGRCRALPRVMLAALGLVLGMASAPAVAQERPLRVVATFSILGDLVTQVGGADVAVRVLVGPDGDAHVYSPTPADVRAVREADLVVVNGLGLEGWMQRLLQASGTKAVEVVAASGVKPLNGEQGDAAHRFDPHAWQDPANVRLYIRNIREGLDAADPAHKADYDRRAAAYLAKLDTLDADIRTTIARIPPAHRRIITTHDAFAYFSHAYGMEFIAPQGVSTDTEASARDVGRIIRQIKAQHIPAVFIENISDPRLIERIAGETGAKIGGKLYSDALSAPGGPAATYLDMMHNNLRAFLQALAP